MTETIVLGLDGANWGVIEDWLTEGRLPKVRDLRERGTHAVSRSELPPVTCPNWKCYSTGKDPGGFGVFWWENIAFDRQDISFPDERSFKSPELWDYLAAAGKTWASLNMPTTYPPRSIANGDIIAGGPLSSESGHASDPELERELDRRFSYRVFPEKTFYDTNATQEEIDTTLDVLETRFDVAEWYIDTYEPEFFHMTSFLLNYIQHFFWDDEPLRRAWEILDERIGAMEDRCRNLVLVSDHGSNEIHTVFYINNWLREEGYLKTDSDVSELFGRVGITQERLITLANFFGLKTLAKKAPESLKSLVPAEEGAKRKAKARIIDWEGTEALASGQGPVYVNRAIEDRDERIDTLIDDLRSLRTPDGRPVASSVYRREEVYSGPYMESAPEVVIEQAPGVHITDGIGNAGVFTDPTRWRAENDRDGIFVASGPDIKDASLGRISLVDVAPTLLHLNGLAVPEDMKGSVLDIFTTESPIDPGDVTYRDPLTLDEEEGTGSAAVEERLSELGYLEQ